MTVKLPAASRLHHALTLSMREKAAFAEAVLALVVAYGTLRLRSFRSVAARLRHREGDDRFDMETAKRCARRVRVMARFLPLRLVCFQQGLALHAMLSRRNVPVSLHFGLCRETPDSLAAHVWVSCAGEVLIGGEERARFTELVRFPDTRVAGADEADVV